MNIAHPTALFTVLLAALLGAAAVLPDASAQLLKNKSKQEKLEPGQFEWHPERAPSGPLLLVVSIDDQVAYVYRNGVQIARSTVSTGKKGHDTPDGVFTILQKHKDHESSIYKGAKMPNMLRLTWTGICMHAGNLPGYPASHGCVRFPLEFSAKLFDITEMGGTVVVTRKASTPSKSNKPASVLLGSSVPADSRPMPEPSGDVVWNPRKSSEGPVNLLLSGADKTVYVFRNGILIGQSPVGIADPETPLPAGVFLMLEGEEPGENPVVPGKPVRPWTILSLEKGGAGANSVADLRQRLRFPEAFGKKVYDLIQPGTILLTTPEPSTKQSQSATDFTIIAPEAAEK